jgi:hypothetical protein
MANSLVIANQIELLGGGVAVAGTGLSAGATYYLAPSWDLGDPQPTVDIAGQLVLDGERPYGRRASNRVIKLPIIVKAPTKTAMAAAVENLLQLIDQQTWTLTWIRDGGALPVIFDCFRAQPSVLTYSVPEQNALASQIAITFEALPYGRSDQQVQVAFPAPLPGTPPAPPPPLLLDNYSTLSGTAWSASGVCVVGPATGLWDPLLLGQPDGIGCQLTYAATFSSPANLTGYTGLSFWLGLGSRYWWSLEHCGRTRISLQFTLIDSSSNTLAIGHNRKLPVANSVTSPAWSQVSLAVPQSISPFLYSSVTGYTITIINQGASPQALRHVVAWLDNLVATPPARVAAAPAIRGQAYTLAGALGTTHAPVSMEFIQPAAAASATVITATGPGTYTVPGGTAWLKVECIGGGGAGAGETAAGVGGGAGAGEYAAETVFACTPGMVIGYSVGLAGTQGASPTNGSPTVFGPAPGAQLVVQANGGQSAAQNSITGGAGGLGSTNSIHYPGGAGRTASGSVGGGGGSSGGSASAGNTPTGTQSTLFTTAGTFTGGWTAPAGVTSILVECWGGGGSAATGGPSTNGAGGAGGEYAAQTVAVTPGNSYNFTVGAGGAAVSGSAHAGNDGVNTSFTADAGVTVTGHAGKHGSSVASGGGGAGGSGSANTTHYTGGTGGSASPYSGSGGSSAGSAAAGNTGSGYGTATSAPTGGGAGGAGTGANSGTNGSPGSQPGGGGGGTYGSTTSGAGATGQIRITYPGGLGAPTNTGASAVTGGGAGGNGGGSSNTAGSAGAQPGGGGGGADSAGTAENGGPGGAGQITITPYASPSFKTLVAHRPGPGAPASLMPFVGVGNGNDTPNGGTEYPVQPIGAPVQLNANSSFSGGVVTPWTIQNSATLTWNAATFGGDPSAVLHGNGSTANPGMLSELVAVTAGNLYQVTADLYSPQGWSNVQIGINWYNSSSAFISSSAAPSLNVVAGVSAGTIAALAQVIAPATAAFGQMFIQLTGTPASTVLLYCDDTTLAAAPMPARFGGSYSVMLVAASWNSPSSSRNLTVTVKQYAYSGGPSYTSSIGPTAWIPQVAGVTSLFAVVGELTLPVKDTAPDNNEGYFTVTVTSSNTSDRFDDCLFIDTSGQTVWVNEPSQGYVNYYVDEPDASQLIGRVLGSQVSRADAVSVLDAAVITGGIPTIEPGDNLLLCYCVEGAPAVSVSYYPRWFFDRLY